jgi:hypothetical protein
VQPMLRDALLAQRGGLIGWLRSILGIGIRAYFAWRFKPGAAAWWAIAALALVLFIATRTLPAAVRPL